MRQRMSFSVSSTPIATALNSIKTVEFGGLDLQPRYQRGYVWKDDFKDKLIYSIIKAYPIGNISVRNLGGNEINEKGAKSEVVDGQQRLTTIRDFVLGDYVIKSEWSKKIIEEIREYFGSKTDKALEKLVKKLGNNKVSLKFDDLPEIIQGNFNTYNISVSYISNASDSQIREYFSFLQNQERLRAGEIINSMPQTELESYLEELKDRELMLDIIGFEDDRREFDKIFYGMIGLLDGKIHLGTTDKLIQKYVLETKKPIDDMGYIDNMIAQLNELIKLDKDKINIKGTRKRFLKYLLLLGAFGYVDFSVDAERKLGNLKSIDDKLSSFFSAKANIEDSTFSGFSDSVRSDLRYVALLTKGAHSLERTKNRMEMLSYYVNNDIPKDKASGIVPLEVREEKNKVEI